MIRSDENVASPRRGVDGVQTSLAATPTASMMSGKTNDPRVCPVVAIIGLTRKPGWCTHNQATRDRRVSTAKGTKKFPGSLKSRPVILPGVQVKPFIVVGTEEKP